MPGIAGMITEKEIEQDIDFLNSFHKEQGVAYLKDFAKFQKATLGRFSVNKFQNDKIFKKTGQNLICTEGITLNLKDLLCQHNVKEFDELILKLHSEYNWKFVEKLRGNFSGFIYSEKNNKLMVFTDHLAAKPVYYFYDKDSNTLIFASELKVVVKGMRQLGFTPHLDIEGAYCIPTFAYMLGDLTLVREIKKLPPGNALLYEEGEIELKEYYKLSSIPYIEGDEEEIIKELDRRFKEAVRLEYEKDLEYGYSHIATLSGGLDSRTNVGYAKKLGFSKITCFTFSESDYLDEKIAKKICLDNHFEFLFYALDNGDYLVKYIDEIVSSNDGLILYSGAAHEYNCLKKISLQDFGLIHTGLIGEQIKGVYLQDEKHNVIDKRILNKIADISGCTKLINKLKNLLDDNHFNYENDELFAFYTNAINGGFNGFRMMEQFTEFSSPFLYIDFLDYAMKIHPKFRYKREMQIGWINKYLQEFSKYTCEKYDLAPRYPLFIMRIYKKIRAIIRRTFVPRHNSMNPFEYWWRTNKTLQKKINYVFNENIQILENYPELLEDSKYLFKEGSLKEKTQVITLLKAIELLGIKGK